MAADGTKRTVRWAIHPWGDSGTETGGIIIFSEDITQRKQTEQALLRSEKLASVGSHGGGHRPRDQQSPGGDDERHIPRFEQERFVG